jgi:uncharacterized protein
MIFVDTSAWYALSSRKDVNHRVANQVLASLKDRLVTSDYIVDETLTLFRSRSESRHAMSFGRQVIERKFAEIITVADEDFIRAWDIFRRFADKQWSFTDCTSRVVMERLGIRRAFAFDEHFHQFGTVSVVP